MTDSPNSDSPNSDPASSDPASSDPASSDPASSDPASSDPASTRQAWSDVGDKLNGLGLKLRLHFEQAKDAQQEAEMRDALTRLREALDDTFTAMRTAARDDAVKADLHDVGNAFSDALGSTFSDAGEELKKVFAKVKSARESRTG